MSFDLKALLARMAAGDRPGPDEIGQAVGAIMDGEVTQAQIASFLTALRLLGETSPDIAAAAGAMRARMRRLDGAADALDVCGTGGDGAHTLNISTAVALVLAGAGVRVAKHGNRAASSKSGGADVLEALGVKLDADDVTLSRALDQAGIVFLFAAAHHPALRHAAPVRRELGFRTLFNLLGPLANPAGVRRQLVGVFDGRWLTPMAEAFKTLGAERVWVVHGAGGLDEIALSGPTDVAILDDGIVRTRTIRPADAGLSEHPAEALRGGEVADNAAALTALLDGAPGAYRDAVLLNAAAALVVAGRAPDLRDGAALAARALDTGAARRALHTLVQATSA